MIAYGDKDLGIYYNLCVPNQALCPVDMCPQGWSLRA